MKIKAAGYAVVLSVLVLSGFSGQEKPLQNPGEDQTIRANVDMVSLPVVVTDRENKRITDLKKEDFRVFENGVEQEISGFAATDEPLSIALMLDTSDSTRSKLAKIQNAAIEFVHQLHPDDEVAILSFADDVKLQSDFTIDRNKNEYGIKKTRTGEWTVAYEAVWLALEEVLKPIRTRKALVLFTDGVDTRSTKASMEETIELSKETYATIFCVFYDTAKDSNKFSGGPEPTVGYPMPRAGPSIATATAGSSAEEHRIGRAYLDELAGYSGGLVLDGSKDLGYAFSEIARELASQYSIGYYSNNKKHDGKFRKLEVRLQKAGLVARTKKGYFIRKDRKK